MNGGRRRVLAPPQKGRKDRDEDLLLFREMHKRDKERVISLLQPVSEDFEPNTGNQPLYKIPSVKKGLGYDFITEGDKNDYDWLKTPPATPLFPSLEMEANAPELALQRAIPIMQPPSRFSGNPKVAEATKNISKSSNPNTRVPFRSVTPSARPSALPSMTRSTKGTQILNQKQTQLGTDLNRRANVPKMVSKSVNQKEFPSSFLASDASRNAGRGMKSAPQSTCVSPLMQTRISAIAPAFSTETPANLRTDRSSSTSRGRPSNATVTIHPKPESIKPRRQSCSPSITRGRKLEAKQENDHDTNMSRGRIQTANGSLAFGSRMVEKVMNARKTANNEDKETTPKWRSPTNERSGFGSILSKNSLEMSLKHMELKQDSNGYRYPSINVSRRDSTSTENSTSSSQSTPRAGQAHEAGNQHSRRKMENKKLHVKEENRSNWGLC